MRVHSSRVKPDIFLIRIWIETDKPTMGCPIPMTVDFGKQRKKSDDEDDYKIDNIDSVNAKTFGELLI